MAAPLDGETIDHEFSDAPSDLATLFEDQHLPAFLGENRPSAQSRHAATNDDRVILRHNLLLIQSIQQARAQYAALIILKLMVDGGFAAVSCLLSHRLPGADVSGRGRWVSSASFRQRADIEGPRSAASSVRKNRAAALPRSVFAGARPPQSLRLPRPLPIFSGRQRILRHPGVPEPRARPRRMKYSLRVCGWNP